MPDRTAADIMTRSLVTFSPDTDIYTAMQSLLRKNITGAPVVDEAGRLMGLLSEKDCLKVLVEVALHGLPEGSVKDYMTRSVVTVTPTTSLYDIVDMFLKGSFRRLPVLENDGRVVGIVTRRDALLAIESIRENSYLYGTPEERPISTSPAEGMGVDSAMRLARGR